MEINISPYDQKDLLELLDYASEMKKEQRPTENKKTGRGSIWDDTNYWVMRIEQLKLLIKGRNISNSLYGSTLPEAEPGEYDKLKEYYQRKKRKNDIFNGKDYYEHNNF